MDNVFLSFFSHALPKIQNQAGIAGMQGRRRLAKMRRTIDIGYSVG